MLRQVRRTVTGERFGPAGTPVHASAQCRRVWEHGIAADRTDDLIHEMWVKVRPPAQIPAAAVVEEAAAEAADWADTVVKYVGGDLDADALETRRALHAANVASLARTVIAATPVSAAAWTAVRIPERRPPLLHRFAAVEIAPARRSGCFDPTRI